jgi:hypothetical protein
MSALSSHLDEIFPNVVSFRSVVSNLNSLISYKKAASPSPV